MIVNDLVASASMTLTQDQLQCSKTDNGLLIAFENDTQVNVHITPDGQVHGIGQVISQNVVLRSDRVMLHPWLRSIDGYDYMHFTLRSIDPLPNGGVVIHTDAHGSPRMESAYGDQYAGTLMMVSENASPVVDQLDWILEPSDIHLDGIDYHGFSYRWQFKSRTQKFHRILTHGSWEIGGQATGNTILSQGQVTPAVCRVQDDTAFTSACLQSLMRFGDPTGMSFQLAPRWGVHQCFDFLTHKQGTLLGYWQNKHDTRSFIQKNPNETVIFVVDAQYMQATSHASTAAKHIVFAPSDVETLPTHQARDRWKSAYDHCCKVIRDLYDINQSMPALERILPYKQRVAENNRFELRVGEQWVASQDWLYALADTMLPVLAEQGIERVMTEPIVQTDPTERGFDNKLQSLGLHQDLNVGSVCCVHRYQPADFFGGMKAWRYFCEKAHSLGMEVGHWIGPHLAHHAPILKEHPEWAIRGFDTMPFAGGYPSCILSVLNWNTPVRQWILDDLQQMREEGGLDYVWFDSFANLGLMPIDYATQMQTNTDAIMTFLAELQQIGIANIAVEGMSPVAISGAHIMDFGANHDGGVQWIAGQNDWHWYEGNEDMLYGQQPRLWAHKTRDEQHIRNRFFRCLANQVLPQLTAIMPATGKPDMKTRSVIDCYQQVKNDMHHRKILPDQKGVLWRNGSVRTLFAFKDQLHIVKPGTCVTCIGNTSMTPVSSDGSLSAKAYQVYRWMEKD